MAASIGILVLEALAGVVLWIMKDTDEWIGLSVRVFEKDVGYRLPPGATRAYCYETGFEDSRAWVAFSSDEESIERHITETLGVKMEDLRDWEPKTGAPLRSFLGEGKASWRSRGYWKPDSATRARVYRSDPSSREGLVIFYDVGNSRLYYIRNTF